MKKIEELAKKAITDNNYFMTDPNHPEFVDRGLEQMRACKWIINHIFSLPLADRLTEEEKERIKAIYNRKRFNTEHSKDVEFIEKQLLEYLFGKAFFQRRQHYEQIP